MRIIERGTFPIKNAQIISGPALDEITWAVFDKMVEDAKAKNDGYGSGLQKKHIDRIFDEIGVEWATRHGSWPKRFVKIMKKHGHVFNNDFNSKMGKIARESCLMASGRVLTITEDFNWSPGDFGDEGSCFWGCRAGAIVMIREHDGDAILIHEENGEPVARCWGLHHNDNYIIFNAYTVHGKSASLVSISRSLSDTFNLAYYRDIKLTVLETGDGPLWINGSKGYIIGSTAVADISEIDLDYSICCSECGDECDSSAYVEDHGKVVCESCKAYTHCSDCECRLHRDNVYMFRGDEYCSDCFHEFAFFCERCGEAHHEDNGHYSETDEVTYCEHCYEHLYSRCVNCDCEVRSYDAMNFEGDPWCEDCYNDKIWECDHCAGDFNSDDEHSHCVESLTGRTIDVCENCHDRYYRECNECGADMDTGLLVIIDDDWYCTDCAAKIEEEELQEIEDDLNERVMTA